MGGMGKRPSHFPRGMDDVVAYSRDGRALPPVMWSVCEVAYFVDGVVAYSREGRAIPPVRW